MERYNSRLEGYEAMTALEVIEHLDPHILSRFGVVTMGTYRPRILLVTTPVSLSSYPPLRVFPSHFWSSSTSQHHSNCFRLVVLLRVLLLMIRTLTLMPNSPEPVMMNQGKDSLILQEGQRGCLGMSSWPFGRLIPSLDLWYADP